MTRLVEKRRVKGLVSLSIFKIHPSLFHSLAHSGSPRAFLNALAMTRERECEAMRGKCEAMYSSCGLKARGDKQTFNISPAEETFEIFALLISSTGSSYFEVSRSRIFQDNAGPRRVSYLIFVENPIH